MRRTILILGLATMLYAAAPAAAQEECDWKRTEQGVVGHLGENFFELTLSENGKEYLCVDGGDRSVSFEFSSSGISRIDSCYLVGKDLMCDYFSGREIPESAQEALDTYLRMVSDSREMCLNAHFRKTLQ